MGLKIIIMQKNQNTADVAKNLHEAAQGYGLNYEQILLCLHAVPYDLLPDFLSTMSRIAEKSGFEALGGEKFEDYDLD